MSREVLISSVVNPPVFNLDRARECRQFARDCVGETVAGHYSALCLAVALSRYNYLEKERDLLEERRFLRKLEKLMSLERSTSDPANPLPTIGWEVEVPRKPFEDENLKKEDIFKLLPAF